MITRRVFQGAPGLVHTVLNRPGPLDIADEAFIVETSRMVFHYLVSE